MIFTRSFTSARRMVVVVEVVGARRCHGVCLSFLLAAETARPGSRRAACLPHSVPPLTGWIPEREFSTSNRLPQRPVNPAVPARTISMQSRLCPGFPPGRPTAQANVSAFSFLILCACICVSASSVLYDHYATHARCGSGGGEHHVSVTATTTYSRTGASRGSA